LEGIFLLKFKELFGSSGWGTKVLTWRRGDLETQNLEFGTFLLVYLIGPRFWKKEFSKRLKLSWLFGNRAERLALSGKRRGENFEKFLTGEF